VPRRSRMAAVTIMMLKTVRMAMRLSRRFWVEMIRTRKLEARNNHSITMNTRKLEARNNHSISVTTPEN